MLEELGVLIKAREALPQKKKLGSKNQDGGPPVVLGGQLVNEQEFADENLC
jgi:hypothetical protein